MKPPPLPPASGFPLRFEPIMASIRRVGGRNDILSISLLLDIHIFSRFILFHTRRAGNLSQFFGRRPIVISIAAEKPVRGLIKWVRGPAEGSGGGGGGASILKPGRGRKRERERDRNDEEEFSCRRFVPRIDPLLSSPVTPRANQRHPVKFTGVAHGIQNDSF